MKNFKIIQAILYSLIIGSISCFAVANESTKSEFWTAYRERFVKKDYSKLAAMTQFPVEVNGTLDDDPIFKISRKNFDKCFSHIFLKDVGFSPNGQTHLVLVKATPDISALKQSGSKDMFRIADLEFKKINGNFKMFRFYLDTSDVSVSKDCK